MSSPPLSSGGLRRVLAHPGHGVVGLVDDLLGLCRDQGLQLDWRADCCRVRSLVGGAEEVVDVAFRKSVRRAILARVAALCNERRPNSVSPYGGQGELSIGDPATVFRVSFTNTPDEQWFQLIPTLDGVPKGTFPTPDRPVAPVDGAERGPQGQPGRP
jgi:hypothetical protein